MWFHRAGMVLMRVQRLSNGPEVRVRTILRLVGLDLGLRKEGVQRSPLKQLRILATCTSCQATGIGT